MASRDRKTKSIGRKVALSLIAGLTLPLLTITAMYFSYQYARVLERPYDAISTLAGALIGFGVGTLVVWKAIIYILR